MRDFEASMSNFATKPTTMEMRMIAVGLVFLLLGTVQWLWSLATETASTFAIVGIVSGLVIAFVGLALHRRSRSNVR